MEIFTSKASLGRKLEQTRNEGKQIGFVPTMGALHQGHLSLIEIAKRNSDVVVCSIFVNPTQFNDPGDLEKYPRPIEADIQKLQTANCDILFLPAVDEMYSGNENWTLDLGAIERVLEGKFRPGHYRGVTQIVKKLFDLVEPDKGYFGQKDFQQVKVIERMVSHFDMPVKVIMCPILREHDGLAMSSRNIHLSPSERNNALALSQALIKTKEHFGSKDVLSLKADAVAFLNSQKGIKLEYFEICDSINLEEATGGETSNLIALVAAYVGNTRLIDNIILK